MTTMRDVRLSHRDHNEMNNSYSNLSERLRLLYKHTGITAIGAVITALLVTIVLYPVMEPVLVIGWFVSIVVINALRYWTSRRFIWSKSDHRSDRKITISQSLIHGIAWGSMAFLVITNTPFTYQAFMVTVIIGVAAIATATSSYLLSANIAFTYPALVPTALALFFSAHNNLHYSLSILVTTATIILPFIANTIERAISNTLQILSQNREQIIHQNTRLIRLKEQNTTTEQVIEKNRRLLDSTSEGILSVDIHGHCNFINPAGMNMLGYTEKELLGVDIHKLLFHTRHDGTRYGQEEHPVFHALYHGKSNRVDEDIMWRKNGSAFPVEYSVSPLFENSIINGAVIMFRDETNTRAMASQLDYLSSHDTLTGLHNRQAFEHKMREMLIETQIEGTHHVLCYLDLDQFKIINDTCGHMAGDVLLKQLADLLKENIRHSDYLARLGGDEFGLLLNSCTLDQAIPVINKLAETIRYFRFNWHGSIFTASMSIGVTEITEQTESSVSALSQADSACYIAKDSGRNRIQIYRANDTEFTKRKGEMEWISQIHDAFEENRFYLMKQPIESTIPSISKGQHLEILLRMKCKNGKTVLPGEFIPPAERYNLMPSLDRWVVRHVFSWLQNNTDQLNRIDSCSINLSGQTVSDEHFQEFVIECLEKYQIPGDKICFEITETAAIANISQAVNMIKLLKRQGCRFSLDDFGSGMSSFSYLKSLDVDYIKIDGNFVSDMLQDQQNMAIIEAIHKVGQAMEIKTIAEFVENNMIRKALKHIGVDYVQGNGISHPVPLNTIEEIKLSLVKN